jgi:uncharacterized protein YjiS (DUF1127 family)
LRSNKLALTSLWAGAWQACKCCTAQIRECAYVVSGRIDLKEIVVMGLFSTAKPVNLRERKIAALKSMTAAELADIGLKPGDIARLERAMRSDR